MAYSRSPALRRFLWLAMLALSLGGLPSQAEETLVDATGSMQKVGNFGYGIVPDDDAGSRYAPTEEVPEAFQVDGLRVIFSGVVGSSEEGRGGRRWGTPIELTRLERLPVEDEIAPAEPPVEDPASERAAGDPARREP